MRILPHTYPEMLLVTLSDKNGPPRQQAGSSGSFSTYPVTTDKGTSAQPVRWRSICLIADLLACAQRFVNEGDPV